jgi:hypothetical protein
VVQVGAQAFDHAGWDVLAEFEDAAVEVVWLTPSDLRGACTVCPVVLEAFGVLYVLGGYFAAGDHVNTSGSGRRRDARQRRVDRGSRRRR